MCFQIQFITFFYSFMLRFWLQPVLFLLKINIFHIHTVTCHRHIHTFLLLVIKLFPASLCWIHWRTYVGIEFGNWCVSTSFLWKCLQIIYTIRVKHLNYIFVTICTLLFQRNLCVLLKIFIIFDCESGTISSDCFIFFIC